MVLSLVVPPVQLPPYEAVSLQDAPTPFLADSVGFWNSLPKDPESTPKACAGLFHRPVLLMVYTTLGTAVCG